MYGKAVKEAEVKLAPQPRIGRGEHLQKQRKINRRIGHEKQMKNKKYSPESLTM
jgi:hypothetical protein